ncbi:MAG: hypothetical protein NTW86_00885 [Candidatus Sumerlaeota bacterium]|nr:hypothetical protein [Candidatus Sumerlaeota bacterium]
MYLAGGAYVKGYLDTKDLKNAAIRGRGILSAENRPDNGRGVNSKTLNIGGDSSKLLVEGVTFIQSVGFACALSGTDNVIRNIKVVGCWHPTTDGVNMGDNSLVEDCFFKCDDDSVKLYQSHVVVRRIVFWQMENGACLQLGWNNSRGARTDVHVYDCDIIRKDSDPKGGAQDRMNNAVISSVGGAADSKDYVIEDIRAENINGRLFSWKTDTGEISDFVIRNFTATNWNSANFHNEIATDRVHDITFENLRINGHTVHNADEAGFKTLGDAKNIRFVVNDPEHLQGKRRTP